MDTFDLIATYISWNPGWKLEQEAGTGNPHFSLRQFPITKPSMWY
jgi:hypothetical protein